MFSLPSASLPSSSSSPRHSLPPATVHSLPPPCTSSPRGGGGGHGGAEAWGGAHSDGVADGVEALRTVAANLLAVLGGPGAAASVPAAEAARLRACVLYLSPSPAARVWQFDEKVKCPPRAVMDLARLAAESGGDPEVIYRALDPTRLPVPDVEGSEKNKCQLTRTEHGRRFANEEINSYFASLFELIVARGPSVGLNVSLSRFDLYHGHLFLTSETGRLGILFHAREYPAYDEELCPHGLGNCQKESNVRYDDSMNLRNILWLAPLPSNEKKECLAPGVLVVLDARPDGIIYQEMIHDEGRQFFRTVDEGDFGKIAGDVNYLNIGNAYGIFFCSAKEEPKPVTEEPGTKTDAEFASDVEILQLMIQVMCLVFPSICTKPMCRKMKTIV